MSVEKASNNRKCCSLFFSLPFSLAFCSLCLVAASTFASVSCVHSVSRQRMFDSGGHFFAFSLFFSRSIRHDEWCAHKFHFAHTQQQQQQSFKLKVSVRFTASACKLNSSILTHTHTTRAIFYLFSPSHLISHTEIGIFRLSTVFVCASSEFILLLRTRTSDKIHQFHANNSQLQITTPDFACQK